MVISGGGGSDQVLILVDRQLAIGMARPEKLSVT